MLRCEIWNGKTPINGVSAEEIIESRRDISYNLNDVFLVIDEYDTVKEIQFGKIIASNYKIDSNKSLQEIADEYLIIKASEEDALIKDQITLEEQSKKIDSLEAEKEELKANLEITQKAVDFMMMNNGGM